MNKSKIMWAMLEKRGGITYCVEDTKGEVITRFCSLNGQLKLTEKEKRLRWQEDKKEGFRVRKVRVEVIADD